MTIYSKNLHTTKFQEAFKTLKDALETIPKSIEESNLELNDYEYEAVQNILELLVTLEYDDMLSLYTTMKNEG